jgi:pyridinium-3,5-biscarboxylic acid mononucleotide sulfurtransferase
MTKLQAILTELLGLARRCGQHELAHSAHRTGVPGFSVVHALSPAVPKEATALVQDHAARFGWRLREVDGGEFADPAYRANPVNRCYFCKFNLYARVSRVIEGPIASGANLDDLGDYRPGRTAAAEHRVRHPFVAASMDKAAVRTLARAFNLAGIFELPAQPCLSNRIETGIAIIAEDLAFDARTERALSAYVPSGADLRCRVTRGGIVVETPASDEAMSQIEDELCHSVRRSFPGFRLYCRGAAFLHGRK